MQISSGNFPPRVSTWHMSEEGGIITVYYLDIALNNRRKTKDIFNSWFTLLTRNINETIGNT